MAPSLSANRFTSVLVFGVSTLTPLYWIVSVLLPRGGWLSRPHSSFHPPKTAAHICPVPPPTGGLPSSYDRSSSVLKYRIPDGVVPTLFHFRGVDLFTCLIPISLSGLCSETARD